MSLEEIKDYWRGHGFGNRTTGYFDNILHDIGWVYITGSMKKIDGKPRRWPSGWCAMPEIKLLKPSNQYTLLKAQSDGDINLEDSIESQPEWVREMFSSTNNVSVTSGVTN